jgi:hypothetical protein
MPKNVENEKKNGKCGKLRKNTENAEKCGKMRKLRKMWKNAEECKPQLPHPCMVTAEFGSVGGRKMQDAS